MDLENKHGVPLDLHKWDSKLFDELFALKGMRFEEDREVDFSVTVY